MQVVEQLSKVSGVKKILLADNAAFKAFLPGIVECTGITAYAMYCSTSLRDNFKICAFKVCCSFCIC